MTNVVAEQRCLFQHIKNPLKLRKFDFETFEMFQNQAVFSINENVANTEKAKIYFFMRILKIKL